MKVFFVSDLYIYGKGGGSLDEQKRYESVLKWCIKNDAKLYSFSLDLKLSKSFKHFSFKKNKFSDIFARLFLHSTFVYMNFSILKKELICSKPSILIYGRTRLGFLCKWVKKHLNINIICMEANVEYDFARACFAKKLWLVKQLELFSVKKDETNCVKYTDIMIFLTNRDLCRFKELYKRHYNFDMREYILPVCLKNEIILNDKNDGINYVVFLASLSYQPNKDAILNFVEFVWKKTFANDNKYFLIIGGKDPDSELINNISNINNCKLFSNFSNLNDIVPKRSVIISPIMSGSGMKVKVAEALSCGLGVIGSSETFVGYDECLKIDKGRLLKISDNINDYSNLIIKYFETISIDEASQICKDYFYKFYSFNVAFKKIDNILNTINISKSENKNEK